MEQERMQKVLDYMEAHLKEDTKGVLDIASLASVAGYSEFHFLRLFRKSVHLTPADYIRKRRISEIVRRIGIESRPISDIAFEYGFNSKENFTRAFKREHGILPTEFLATNCSLHLFAPFTFDRTVALPQVSMCYMKPFSLTVYPSAEREPPLFWNRYNRERRSFILSGGAAVTDFGVMIKNPQSGILDYYIGIRSEEAKGNLDGTVRLEIDGGLYAVFETPPATQHDFVSVIQDTWKWIYAEWMPQSGYVRGKGFEMESYVESGRSFCEHIFVPLKKQPKGE